MTRRERLEKRAERATEFAQKATARATSAYESGKALADRIPFGQPILVGHHSESRSRRDAERIGTSTQKFVDESKKAERHERRAEGIAAQLEKSIFSDDTDAAEALKARISERTAEVDRMKAVNAAFAKATGQTPSAKALELLRAGTITEAEAKRIARLFQLAPYETKPFPAYAITNARGSIRRDQERLAEVQEQAQRATTAAASGGVLVEDRGEYVVVTFAEKPAADVLDSLRSSGFRWARGSWVGPRATLPAGIGAVTL